MSRALFVLHEIQENFESSQSCLCRGSIWFRRRAKRKSFASSKYKTKSENFFVKDCEAIKTKANLIFFFLSSIANQHFLGSILFVCFAVSGIMLSLNFLFFSFHLNYFSSWGWLPSLDCLPCFLLVAVAIACVFFFKHFLTLYAPFSNTTTIDNHIPSER